MNTIIDSKKLFFASCMALVVTAMSFGLRAGFLGAWTSEFQLTNEQVGWIGSTAFFGFTLSMIIGGPLCDMIGMKKIIVIAFIGHLAGIVLTMLSKSYWPLFFSTLLIGIANGMVEAACNPLVASLFPNEKVKMLNRFHVWFPGGIVIGGLIGYFLGKAGVSWQIQLITMIIPTLIYGFLFLKESFPLTERVSAGISSSEMYKSSMGGIMVIIGLLLLFVVFYFQIVSTQVAMILFALMALALVIQLPFAKALFPFMVFCMFITAASELGTGQLIEGLLKGNSTAPILVLVFINGLMMIGRTFAGEIVHKISAAGMLLFSAVFTTLGLLWLSSATGYTSFAAAFVFALGVCFFWPTMLGFVSENLPKTGALGMSIMGGAGMLSVSLVLPILGKSLDNTSGSETLRFYAILPAFLILAFAILFLWKRNRSTV